MKYAATFILALAMTACGDNKHEEGDNHANTEQNVEQHSGENVSPQLSNQNDTRMGVDSISTASEAEHEKKENLH